MRQRADALTAAHRVRAARGEKHPVEDFLFTYYSYKPSVLRRWHPGAGVELAGAARLAEGRVAVVRARAAEPARSSSMRRVPRREGASRRGRREDSAVDDRPRGFFRLLRTARVGDGLPAGRASALRSRCDSGKREPTRSSRAHELRCTHFDAFRFFTPEAAPRNRDDADPRTAAGAWSSPAACTPGWTSTSGR